MSKITGPSYPTEQYGTVLSVGGIPTCVLLQTLDGTYRYCPVTEDLARKLGARLYTVVGLAGIMELRNMPTGNVFHPIQMLPYQDRPLAESFAALREIAGDAFDRIDDVDAYIAELRSDGTEDRTEEGQG